MTEEMQALREEMARLRRIEDVACELVTQWRVLSCVTDPAEVVSRFETPMGWLQRVVRGEQG